MNICMRSSRGGDCMFTEVWKNLTKQIIFFSLYSKKKVFLYDELRSFPSFVHGGQPKGWDIRLGAAWPKKFKKRKIISRTVQKSHNLKIFLRVTYLVSFRLVSGNPWLRCWILLRNMIDPCAESSSSKTCFQRFSLFVVTTGLCVTQTEEWQGKSRHANVSMYMVAVNACISSKQVVVLLRRPPALEANQVFR